MTEKSADWWKAKFFRRVYKEISWLIKELDEAHHAYVRGEYDDIDSHTLWRLERRAQTLASTLKQALEYRKLTQKAETERAEEA